MTTLISGGRSGLESSGLFCALDHVVGKVEQEQEVDVFNAVKKIRTSQPQLIPTLVRIHPLLPPLHASHDRMIADRN